MKFYKDEECTEEVSELNLEESYVQDVYGGILENAMIVGTEIHKTLYLKNTTDNVVTVDEIVPSSPFVQATLDNVQLEPGQIATVQIVFSPQEDALRELEAIEETEQRIAKRKELLNCSIRMLITEYMIT